MHPIACCIWNVKVSLFPYPLTPIFKGMLIKEDVLAELRSWVLASCRKSASIHLENKHGSRYENRRACFGTRLAS
jgi:hypothetical protein